MGGAPKSAYFMVSGLASEVVQLQDGEFVEIGIVGYEGVTGAYHLLGPASSLSHCFIQMSGSAYELPYAELEELFATSPDIRAHVLKYVQHQMAHLGQTAACNRVHDAGPRFCALVAYRTRSNEGKGISPDSRVPGSNAGNQQADCQHHLQDLRERRASWAQAGNNSHSESLRFAKTGLCLLRDDAASVHRSVRVRRRLSEDACEPASQYVGLVALQASNLSRSRLMLRS